MGHRWTPINTIQFGFVLSVFIGALSVAKIDLMMKAINPTTEEIIAEYPEHTSGQIEEILQNAERAFGRWRGVAISDRAVAMRGVAGVLRKRRDELAKLMTGEVGKTIVASEAEIEKCAVCCEYFAENAAGFLADRRKVW